MSRKRLIYFAAPLFSNAEKWYNETIVKGIELLGFSVFLPQRDGVDRNKPPYDKMEKDDRRAALFALDRERIYESDIFLFVLDGRIPDEGACVELGMAYTQKILQKKHKKIIGLQTDSRAAFVGGKLNPMVKGAFDEIFDSEEKLMGFLTQYLQDRE